MAMYCPACGTAYEQRLHCPGCGSRLTYLEAGRRGGGLRALSHGWQHTSWGRVLIGLALAQGLYHGLHHLLAGVLLALQPEGTAQDALRSLPGTVGVQVLQVVALLLGGLLTGAGQRSGFLLGGVMGLCSGAVALVLRHWTAAASPGLLPDYLQPVLQGTLAALGGGVGCTIWKPLAAVVNPDTVDAKRKPAGRPRTSLFAGKIHWIRVLLGVALSVAGCLSATVLLEGALAASNDALATENHLQEKLVTWEIKALAMLLGGAFAGACTSNGFKQGLVVGVLGGAVLNAVLAYRFASLQVVALTMLSSLGLAVAGGWFGGQLFPPVVRYRRPKGLGPAAA